jgi:hypothetical protein
MKIFLISQKSNNSYDTYNEAVVCAETAEEARTIDPSGSSIPIDNKKSDYSSWAIYDDITAIEIGIAFPETKKGVICASFNAG